MAKRRKRTKSGRGGTGALAELRKQAQFAMKRLRRAGQRQISAIEGQIRKLNKQKEVLLNELSVALGGGGRSGGKRGRAASSGRRGRRSRVDWDKVFTQLPKGSFKASDVRKIVAGVAPGTLSQRLTGWVNERKLKRTGSRRGTRYTKAA